MNATRDVGLSAFDTSSLLGDSSDAALYQATPTQQGGMPKWMEEPSDGNGHAAKIMLVDDEPLNIKVVRKHLCTRRGIKGSSRRQNLLRPWTWSAASTRMPCSLIS